MFDAARNMPFTLRIPTAANALTPNETWGNPFPILGVSTLTPDWLWKDPDLLCAAMVLHGPARADRHMSLEVGYVGSSGVHLYRTTYYNEPQPGPPTATSTPGGLSPTWDSFRRWRATASPTTTRSRCGCRSVFPTASRCSVRSVIEKSIDNASGVRQANGDEYVPQDVYNLTQERGPSAFNFGKRWVNSFLYATAVRQRQGDVGRRESHCRRRARRLATGWHFHLARRLPLFGVLHQQLDVHEHRLGTCRADATGMSPSSSNATPTHWFNPAAFVNRVNFVAGVGPYTYRQQRAKRYRSDPESWNWTPLCRNRSVSPSEAISISARSSSTFRIILFLEPRHDGKHCHLRCDRSRRISMRDRFNSH